MIVRLTLFVSPSCVRYARRLHTTEILSHVTCTSSARDQHSVQKTNIKKRYSRIGLGRFWAPYDFDLGMLGCRRPSRSAIRVNRTEPLIAAGADIGVHRAAIGRPKVDVRGLIMEVRRSVTGRLTPPRQLAAIALARANAPVSAPQLDNEIKKSSSSLPASDAAMGSKRTRATGSTNWR
jgi:hypothetical protein